MRVTNSSSLSWTAFSHTPQINNKLNLYLLSGFSIFKWHCNYNSELFFTLKRMRTPQVKKKKRSSDSRSKIKLQNLEISKVTLKLPKPGDLETNLKLVRLVTKNDKFINTRVRMSTNKKKGNERRKQKQSCHRRKIEINMQRMGFVIKWRGKYWYRRSEPGWELTVKTCMIKRNRRKSEKYKDKYRQRIS